jgi:uncharacterized protein
MERRFIKSEVRLVDMGQASSPGTAVGYAATYNRKSTDLGGFVEQINSNAFKRSLQSGDDVFCFLNHSPDFPLGRLKNKTLQLSSDSKGLKMRCQLPDTSTGRDVANLLTRGDLSEMSFGFVVDPGGDSWGEEDSCECGEPGCTDPTCARSRVKVRTLHSVRLIDTSIVSQPAYPGTSVSIDPLVHVLTHSLDALFPSGIPAEVRSHVDVYAAVRERRRQVTNLILSM